MGIKKGVDITRESWQVLKQDRELLVFPVFSALTAVAIVATIVGSGFLIPSFGRWSMDVVQGLQRGGNHTAGERALGIVCLFAVYFIEWFIVIFFNTALVGCAMKRFSGGDPTIRDGFRIAFGRLPQIFAWALLTSAVGTLLSAIEQRLGWLGKIVIRLIGLTWAVSTYFVVPVLVAEGTGPLTAVRRSVTLLRKTWGEGLVGNFVIQLATTAVTLVTFFLAVCGFALAGYLGSIVLAVATGVLLVMIFVLMSIVTSAMRQVFLAGLYCYATTGEVPQGFSEDVVKQALQTS